MGVQTRHLCRLDQHVSSRISCKSHLLTTPAAGYVEVEPPLAEFTGCHLQLWHAQATPLAAAAVMGVAATVERKVCTKSPKDGQSYDLLPVHSG